MSEISNIPPSPSQPRTAIREIQPETAAAQLGQVEEDANTDNANTPAAFRRNHIANTSLSISLVAIATTTIKL
jgi:hypothetical protein